MIPVAALLLMQTPPPAPPSAPPAVKEEVPPARITLTTPFPVHLGSVGPREVREAVFGIKSTHDRAFHLRVLDLSLGLNLDEAQLQQPLEPGEVRLVKLQVNPTGMEGYVKGAVRLGTDDPAQPNYILRYDMIVRPEVAVDQLRKSFGDVAPYERPEVRFRFTREGGDPLKLVVAGDVPEHLRVEVVPEVTTAEVRVSLLPGRLAPGTTAGLEVLKVATNAPKQPLFTLYVDWRVATAVEATPSRLVFSDLKTTLEGLELKARDGKPFRILTAKVEGPGFQVLDHPTDAAERHVLRIRRLPRAKDALLILTCSNMEGPLRVPLRFLDPRARPAHVTLPESVPEPEHHHH